MSLQNCRLVSLPKITDGRGNLAFLESYNHIPFQIERVYYLYDVPLQTIRGEHAHFELEQLIIACSGSIDITLDDGYTSKKYTLNDPCCGLYVAPLIWRRLENFKNRAVCLVMASKKYQESDYIRNYTDFIRVARNK